MFLLPNGSLHTTYLSGPDGTRTHNHLADNELSYHWTTGPYFVTLGGLEPPSSGSKPDVLPLDDRVLFFVVPQGLEPRLFWTKTRRVAKLHHRTLYKRKNPVRI